MVDQPGSFISQRVIPRQCGMSTTRWWKPNRFSGTSFMTAWPEPGEQMSLLICAEIGKCSSMLEKPVGPSVGKGGRVVMAGRLPRPAISSCTPWVSLRRNRVMPRYESSPNSVMWSGPRPQCPHHTGQSRSKHSPMGGCTLTVQYRLFRVNPSS